MYNSKREREKKIKTTTTTQYNSTEKTVQQYSSEKESTLLKKDLVLYVMHKTTDGTVPSVVQVIIQSLHS